MTQNNIKTLIQCEKEASALIADARKERESLKRKAKKDALVIVHNLSHEKHKQIEAIEAENKRKLEDLERQIKIESQKDLETLDGIELSEVIDIVVDMIQNAKSN